MNAEAGATEDARILGAQARALEDAATVTLTEDEGVPWDHDYDRATVAIWLQECSALILARLGESR